MVEKAGNLPLSSTPTSLDIDLSLIKPPDKQRDVEALRINFGYTEEEIEIIFSSNQLESHPGSGFKYSLDSMFKGSRILIGTGSPGVEGTLHGHPDLMEEEHVITQGELTVVEFELIEERLKLRAIKRIAEGQTHKTASGLWHLSFAGPKGVRKIIRLTNADMYPRNRHHIRGEKTLYLPTDYRQLWVPQIPTPTPLR